MIGLIQRIFRRTSRQRPLRRAVHRAGTEMAFDSALVGRSKQQVHETLGPPRNATLEGPADPADPALPLFWQATTWYYPFDSAQRTAMAIQFSDGIVRRVELIHTAAEAITKL